jgi:hypothetical protein
MVLNFSGISRHYLYAIGRPAQAGSQSRSSKPIFSFDSESTDAKFKKQLGPSGPGAGGLCHLEVLCHSPPARRMLIIYAIKKVAVRSHSLNWPAQTRSIP